MSLTTTKAEQPDEYESVIKETIDISSEIEVKGLISYNKQTDLYEYIAPLSGRYRFWTERTNSCNVKIEIFNNKYNVLDYATNALSVDLVVGEKYYIDIILLAIATVMGRRANEKRDNFFIIMCCRIG